MDTFRGFHLSTIDLRHLLLHCYSMEQLLLKINTCIHGGNKRFPSQLNCSLLNEYKLN